MGMSSQWVAPEDRAVVGLAGQYRKRRIENGLCWNWSWVMCSALCGRLAVDGGSSSDV